MAVRWLPAAAALLLVSGCFGAPGPEFPDEAGRLMATAKLWAAVNYFHPKLASNRVDWDAALVKALPAIRSAGTAPAYATALGSLLDQLGDPSSYISDGSGSPHAAAAMQSGPAVTWVHHGVHPAFMIVDQAPPPLTLPMGGSVSATLNLSEPSTSSMKPEFPRAPVRNDPEV